MKKQSFKFISIPYTIDRKLYKYYSNTAHAINSVRHKNIHLESPKDYNDPFDSVFCCYNYSQQEISGTKKEHISNIHKCLLHSKINNKKQQSISSSIMLYLLNSNWDTNEICSLNSVVKDIYNHFGDVDFTFDDFCLSINEGFLNTNPFFHIDCKMSCFSEVKDSILMWSYHSNCHKGICIEYDLSKLDNGNELNNEIFKNISKVHYSPIRADTLIDATEDSWLNFLTSKADVWSHEHEWRIICETNEEYLPFDCISGIYLGARFNINSTTYQKLLAATTNYTSLKIYQSKLNTIEYKINFEEIYDTQFETFLKKSQILRTLNNNDLPKIG